MWGQIKSHVPNMNVGKVFGTEMAAAAAAPMSFLHQLPSIQNFLVAVKVMTAGGGGGGGGGVKNHETST